MKRIFIIAVFLAVFGILFSAFFAYQRAHAPAGQVCTLEAKLCPDGSYVGRTGPHCEFSACPGEDQIATSTDTGGEGSIPPASGIEGTVLLGPTCPVMREPPDPACAEKPYATAILVYRAGATTPIAISNSDENGKFHIPLPSGAYRVVAKGGTTLPRCDSTETVVVPGEFTEVGISCDTGIR